MPYEPPHELVEALRSGGCIAFVGAGFSQPLMPSWHDLLGDLVKCVPVEATRDTLTGWLGSTKPLTSQDYAAIAESIHRALDPHFARDLKEALVERAAKGAEPAAKFRRRHEWLRQIPFRGILTTNFDPLLDGNLPGPDAYGDFLSAHRSPWWSARFWTSSRDGKVPLLKLHGDVSQPDPQVVFTARQYRRLIHETPNYRAFLRTLFATNSILFLGFSFTDAYINDLRSEVLAMVGLDRDRRGCRDFAVLGDVNDELANHLAEVDGLVPLRYTTASDPEHTGFDAWMASIAAATNPEATLRERLKGRRLLWLDASPSNNDHGFAVLSGGDGRAAAIEQVTSVDAALGRLESERQQELGGGYDLVITHWGHQGEAAPANAVRLLREMRRRALCAPVIVFASGAHRSENRGAALRLGALAYTNSWPELFRTLDDLVTDHGARRR